MWYDFDSLLKLNTAMGRAGVVCIDDRVCMVQLGSASPSSTSTSRAGKCTPCRDGDALDDADPAASRGRRCDADELDLLLDVCDRITASARARSARPRRWPVASYVDKFRAEFVAHSRRRARSADESPLARVWRRSR
jgi:NADH-quinone oxidoreductase subunit F